MKQLECHVVRGGHVECHETHLSATEGTNVVLVLGMFTGACVPIVHSPKNKKTKMMSFAGLVVNLETHG